MTMKGAVLADRYAVGELLGRGGMAEVYLGTDRVLDRPVAVKVLGAWLAHDATFVERFRREALAAARISHPNLVAVYDTGSEDEIHYIVMEHVPGHTLADVLRTDGRLDPTRAGRIVRDVAAALAVAHRAGIVHRDVKPANVMITPDAGTKLMDLGIARRLDVESITRASSVLGTAGYVSPEQARGDRVDNRSDIYSLGCVAYEMLTGRPPFEADNPVAVAYQHVHDDPAPPSSVEPSVPLALEAVTLRAMAKDPAERFQTVEEMAAALEEDTVRVAPLAPTSPLPVHPPTTRLPRRAARSRRRRPLIPLFLALAALAAMAGLGFALLAGGEPAGSGPRGSPTSSAGSSVSESSSPSSTPPAVADPVEVALEGVFAVVDRGVLESAITPKVAADLRKRATDAYETFQDGDTEKATEKLDELRDKVEEAVDHEEIAHPYKQKLDKAIEELEEQMLRAAPPEEEGSDG
jgi:serine/threonine-protein kinase